MLNGFIVGTVTFNILINCIQPLSSVTTFSLSFVSFLYFSFSSSFYDFALVWNDLLNLMCSPFLFNIFVRVPTQCWHWCCLVPNSSVLHQYAIIPCKFFNFYVTFATSNEFCLRKWICIASLHRQVVWSFGSPSENTCNYLVIGTA